MQNYVETFRSWSKNAEYVEDLVHLTHEGHRHLASLPEIFQDIAGEATLQSMRFKAERAQREIDDDFWMLHAHSLMGLWGSMEVLVEDIFANRLLENQTLYEDEAFDKIKLPVATLGQVSQKSVARATLKEVSKSAATGSAPGRFEKVLKFVRLDGKVPAQVSHAIYNAHQIRNVCAHKAGFADDHFVEMCPEIAVDIGERIPLSIEEFDPLMHGLHMYASILLNRIRATFSDPLISTECRGYEGTMKEAFPGQFDNARVDP